MFHQLLNFGFSLAVGHGCTNVLPESSDQRFTDNYPASGRPPRIRVSLDLVAIAVVLLTLLTATLSFAASNTPAASFTTDSGLRFESEIRAFAEADRTNPPVPGGILFVGSSIFRQWTNVTQMMAPMPVLNRAFGGSRTGEQLTRFEQVVVPYAPKVIVYYCGSNDLKAGDEPDAIFARFKAFSERVRQGFPETRIVFVSSTRSPDRVAKWERVDHYNGLVRSYCAATPHHTFVDINPALYDQEGKPRLELYRDDKLHFHQPAYAEFAGIIKPVLTRVWAEVTGSPDSPPAAALERSKPDTTAPSIRR